MADTPLNAPLTDTAFHIGRPVPQKTAKIIIVDDTHHKLVKHVKEQDKCGRPVVEPYPHSHYLS